ncbi:MAG: glycosyltransferase [Pseudomonadota bacterium]
MNSGGALRFALIVPTLNAGEAWPAWLSAVAQQSRAPDTVLVVDSSSTDDTAVLASQAGFDVAVIDRAGFDHGGTRQRAFDRVRDAVDVAAFLTQDAELADSTALAALMAAFDDPGVGCAYGRQLARPSHTAIARHHRTYNYPDEPARVDASDLERQGLRAAFCSNSFAAYRSTALSAAGGFPESVVFGEDMLAALRILRAGYAKCYVPAACVWHAHDYTPLQEYKRYFDMGVMHAAETELHSLRGGAGASGRAFVRSEIRAVAGSNPLTAFALVCRNGLRYLGYRIGLRAQRLPAFVKRAMTMNKAYFTTGAERR